MCVRKLVLAGTASLALAVVLSSNAMAATVYAGLSPTAASDGLVFASLKLTGDPHESIHGAGGNGDFSFTAFGDSLDGNPAHRVYMFDTNAGNLGVSVLPSVNGGTGTTNRGDANFAMMVWEFSGVVDFLRMYPHQDHLDDPNARNDVVEQSLWVSTDGNHFTLLSDITAHNGAAFGSQTYTHDLGGGRIEATTIYRDGSTEFGVENAYTRDWVLPTPYKWFGIRTSSLGLSGADADPEIDALAGRLVPVPLPPAALSALPLLAGIAAMAFRRRRRTA